MYCFRHLPHFTSPNTAGPTNPPHHVYATLLDLRLPHPGHTPGAGPPSRGPSSSSSPRSPWNATSPPLLRDERGRSSSSSSSRRRLRGRSSSSSSSRRFVGLVLVLVGALLSFATKSLSHFG